MSWHGVVQSEESTKNERDYARLKQAADSGKVVAESTRVGEARMNNLMEITEKERLSREEAAARLHALADALARHNDVEFDRGGVHFKVHVPDEVDFKLEIEFDDEEREIEIELKW
jgi:amphi-Trp domain-containing protein